MKNHCSTVVANFLWKELAIGSTTGRWLVATLLEFGNGPLSSRGTVKKCHLFLTAFLNWLLIFNARFLSFELEDEKDCLYDYVEVYDGWDDTGSLLGKICGTSVRIANCSAATYTQIVQSLSLKIKLFPCDNNVSDMSKEWTEDLTLE